MEQTPLVRDGAGNDATAEASRWVYAIGVAFGFGLVAATFALGGLWAGLCAVGAWIAWYCIGHADGAEAAQADVLAAYHRGVRAERDRALRAIESMRERN